MSLLGSLKLKKITVAAALAMVLPTVLTGCAPAFDEDLVATCDGIRSNLNILRDYPAELADYEFASESYMATNIGDAKREQFALLVNELYPWIPTYADHSVDAFYYAGVEGGLWQRATEGTPVAYEVSSADQAEYLTDDGKSLEDILGVSIESIIGDGYVTGCAEYDKKRLEELESSDNENAAYYAWHHSQSVANDIASQYKAVSQCIATGKYLGSKCAKEDYVSDWDWSDYDIEPTNPWEREWSTDWLEGLAKFTWCYENGYNDYSSARDTCVY